MTPFQEMKDKYAKLLSSTRFHQVLAVFAMQVIAHYYLTDDYVLDALSVFFASVATIGTADSIAEKASSIIVQKTGKVDLPIETKVSKAK